MSAFAMHAKTSAFAAGARVLSSQKKTNNSNSNRCERPFPAFCVIQSDEKFVFLISCGKERSLPRECERERGGLCVHIQ
jgi:hypothetical protein